MIGSALVSFSMFNPIGSALVSFSVFNPIALRKAKIVYNFGLSECNRLKVISHSCLYIFLGLYQRLQSDIKLRTEICQHSGDCLRQVTIHHQAETIGLGICHAIERI